MVLSPALGIRLGSIANDSEQLTFDHSWKAPGCLRLAKCHPDAPASELLTNEASLTPSAKQVAMMRRSKMAKEMRRRFPIY